MPRRLNDEDHTMTRTALRQLKRTHGRTGQPIMPAIEDEPDALDDVLDRCLPAERTVDGEPTPLHLALLDAMTSATTWRT
jgi:hypothetical protein